MIFCHQCVNYEEIKEVIKGLNKKGTCEICGSTEVFLYNTDTDSELVEPFENLINIYTPKDFLSEDYPKEKLNLLSNEFQNTWNVFNNLSKNQVYNLIKNICKDKYDNFPQLFDDLVGIPDFQNEDYLKANLILPTNSWKKFVDDLKNKNRFHTKINEQIFEVICSFTRKAYKKGDIFYRGRIISDKAYAPNEMGAPIPEKAAAGRANSFGIRCLYLANDRETTIHEVRAGAYDHISIGTFRLLQNIVVVNLRLIDKISPFVPNLDCKQYLLNKDVLKKMSEEMAKPLRRNDTPLEYIPTQYISEFIKSIEYDGRVEYSGYSGIEYDSTVNPDPDSYNLAIFNPELFECTEVIVCELGELNYSNKRFRKCYIS